MGEKLKRNKTKILTFFVFPSFSQNIKIICIFYSKFFFKNHGRKQIIRPKNKIELKMDTLV